MKNKLKHDIVVYRNDKYADSLEGTVKKFLSTSVTRKGALQGQPNVAIIVPKGSNGAYVEDLRELKEQREFLFRRDLHLKKILSDGVFYNIRGGDKMKKKLTFKEQQQILYDRMQSENSGYIPTEEERELGRKRSEHIHKLALEELKKQGFKI